MPRRSDGEPRVLDEREIEALVAACDATRYPHRNRAVVLLACDAGLTPKEIAGLRRHNVLTDDGVLGDTIDLVGKPGRYLRPRTVPIGRGTRLWHALRDLLANVPGVPRDPLVLSERALSGGGAARVPDEGPKTPMRPDSICFLFWKLFERVGVADASARSGRATFIVRTGTRLRSEGGSIEDLMRVAGQRSAEDARRYLGSVPLPGRAGPEPPPMRDLFDPLRR